MFLNQLMILFVSFPLLLKLFKWCCEYSGLSVFPQTFGLIRTLSQMLEGLVDIISCFVRFVPSLWVQMTCIYMTLGISAFLGHMYKNFPSSVLKIVVLKKQRSACSKLRYSFTVYYFSLFYSVHLVSLYKCVSPADERLFCW